MYKGGAFTMSKTHYNRVTCKAKIFPCQVVRATPGFQIHEFAIRKLIFDYDTVYNEVTKK